MDEEAFTEAVGKLLSWQVPLRVLWCLLDTDGGYTGGQRDVYRSWLQKSVLVRGRGEELRELGAIQGETSRVASGAPTREDMPAPRAPTFPARSACDAGRNPGAFVASSASNANGEASSAQA